MKLYRKNNQGKIRVLLLFGGESTEHDVSIASARNVYEALDGGKYEVLLGYIDDRGSWSVVKSIDGMSRGGERLNPVLGSGCFTLSERKEIYQPDVILPILHGKNGEDGSIAALGQLLHIPVVGCDMTSAAVCMDKILTKQIVASYNIPVVPYLVVRRDGVLSSYQKVSEQLGERVFVKPARSGSSVGVSRAGSESEYEAALKVAFEQGNTALIEAGVDARELEVAVLGTPPHHKVSVAGEIVPDADFYTYESKYDPDSATEAIIPAGLSSEQRRTIKNFASTIFEALGCSGLARIDFFLASDGIIYLNEVNTLPGFTDISMYPKLWQHGGIDYRQLLDVLIEEACG